MRTTKDIAYETAEPNYQNREILLSIENEGTKNNSSRNSEYNLFGHLVEISKKKTVNIQYIHSLKSRFGPSPFRIKR